MRVGTTEKLKVYMPTTDTSSQYPIAWFNASEEKPSIEIINSKENANVVSMVASGFRQSKLGVGVVKLFLHEFFSL